MQILRIGNTNREREREQKALQNAGKDSIRLPLSLNICYSPAGRSVLGKTVPDVLDTARGRRPRAVSKTEGTVFPNTDRPSAGE